MNKVYLVDHMFLQDLTCFLCTQVSKCYQAVSLLIIVEEQRIVCYDYFSTSLFNF